MKPLFALIIAGAAAGCSTQDLYNVTQGWKAEECRRILDRDERARCEKSAAMSYEQYRRERDAARAPKPAP